MYLLLKKFATNIDVGPSAAPIIPIDAASFKSKPNNAAALIVKNIPNCAAAPNNNILGFVKSGPKSIIAPIPINNINGNNSLAIPILNKLSIIPISSCPPIICVIAPEKGIFTRIAPKPIGNNSAGSKSFLTAR
ncbi:hypothetical protein SDC9_79886 [bioreactor metagenome]|uniref:Uncharacterized protein n=1 Tax=bioreactor metagenome TaxID=1076179 RepID=A0A644Z3J4_9ZZZZ